jgi:hypothetical protein
MYRPRSSGRCRKSPTCVSRSRACHEAARTALSRTPLRTEGNPVIAAITVVAAAQDAAEPLSAGGSTDRPWTTRSNTISALDRHAGPYGDALNGMA